MPKRKGSKKAGKDLKVILVGDGAVGKTTLIHRFCDETFKKTYLATVGVDITTKAVDVGSDTYTFVFWDVSGQEKFKAQRAVFYKGTNGVIMVCDCTSLATVETLPNWKSEVERACGILPIVLLVNKVDLESERKVLSEHISRVRKALGIPQEMIFETSALDGKNVDTAFFRLGETMLSIIKSGKASL